ncbi:hypothetical protein [Aliiglaciecola sp. LCG003]|uniref:hypothetical protein n=1 Tax=Aliiglaciecola sp. LCG003 TaxID=3053655 RepID=UPI002572501F|nr:hypothetical protein [Aliiglaciecola sp. LCG003]WJG08629.1 hypothetical protein QR722_14970 [Aliiglaciecola sp. LCG003]
MLEQQQNELFAAWMEDNLNPDQRQQFERLCSEDVEFNQRVQVASHGLLLAQDYQQQSVPNWQREESFDMPDKASWWQWQGLPAFSGALSMLAIILVVSGFEARFEQGALTISFSQKQPDIEQIVEQRLVEFKQDQQQALANYALSLREQQLDASTQLTNYLLSSSRKERREDFGELIKFINEQRSDDQLFYARQLNQLEQEIYSSPTSLPWDQTSHNSNSAEQ